MTEILEQRTRSHVRYLVLNRPEARNALDPRLGWAIGHAIADAHADDDVRVIALTANGSAFCAGLDLQAAEDGAIDDRMSAQERALDDKGWVGRFLLGIRFDTDKPVVVGINGVAVGAGVALAMAGDIRIAARTARLHPGYIRVGASPDGGLSWTLPLLVGHERAMRFLLEGEFVGADDARAQGFVGEVVDDDALRARLTEYCEGLAARSPIALRQTKRLVARAPLVEDVDRRVADELRTVLACLDTDEARAAREDLLRASGSPSRSGS